MNEAHGHISTWPRVQEWLGHATPSFTLETYVHLMDEGIGDAAFMDRAVGKGWARQHAIRAANGM